MPKKAQVYTIIIYVIVVALAGLSLYIVFGGINNLKTAEKTVEVNNFVTTFENSLKAQKLKSVGSIEPISFSVPSEVEMVCFIDDKEKLSPLTVTGLTKEKEFYSDRNIFFFPTGKFTPAKISFVKINKSENPLCVKNVNNKINLKLTTTTGDTLIEASSKEQRTENCIVVSGSSVGDPDTKIDLVFLGYGYNNKSRLADDVDDYVSNYLFKISPFISNKDKFNLWLIDEKQPNCSITSYVMCDSYSVNKIVSDCPNDYIFILVDSRIVTDSIRSSAISNMAKINTRDNKLVLLHEFGHSFGGLADEYTDRYYESWFDSKDYPNCDVEGCSKWSSVEGTGCLQGCSTNQFYRSVDYSIMRDYDKSSIYGILNQRIINDRLEEYK